MNLNREWDWDWEREVEVGWEGGYGGKNHCIPKGVLMKSILLNKRFLWRGGRSAFKYTAAQYRKIIFGYRVFGH